MEEQMTNPVDPPVERGRSGLVSQHGRAIVEIGFVSGLGILATTGFQIVTIRGLGPQAFGLLASFIALINVASIGSSALRNSVAVMTADSSADASTARGVRRRIDGSLVEALVLGAIGTVAILVVAPLLSQSLSSNLVAILVTAAAITPYFLFARAQGRLQGVGDARAVVWWSTGAQVAQLALACLVLVLGFGFIGVLLALLLCAVVGAAGASMQARRFGIPPVSRPFTMNSTAVLVLTLAFAWLTNADVVLVRGGAPEQIAGAYAAAAVLIKTSLIIPATLSLYLLPRFVQRRGDASMTQLGVNVILVATFATGALMLIAVLLFGSFIVGLLFGSSYDASIGLLPWFALTWIPWAMAQGVLIRVTAIASRLGLVLMLVAAVAQWLAASILLPDVVGMMIANGCVGLVVFVSLYLIHHVELRKTRRAP
jgi:O-antigen/teichoic acid export membrane protein